jgi:1-phosphofructokinase
MPALAKLITVTFNPAIDLACNVPGLTLGQVNRVREFQSDAGGKGVNIARLLRLFNLEVSATGFLGRDNTGIFEKLFRNTGIEDRFVRVPGTTRTGIKMLDPKTQSTTDLNFPGLSPGPEHLKEFFEVIERQLHETAVVIIAGSLPPAVSPEVVGTLVSMIKNRGSKVYVDSSGPALSSAIEARPTLIKPNLDELSEYLGYQLENNDEIVNEVKKLLRLGIETVVVSLGERGSIFAEKDKVLFATPPPIEAVSTVGAGDAIVGSMAAGMVLKLPLRERARLATSVSAAVVTQPGPGLASLNGARVLEKQVAINDQNNSGGTDE